MSSIEDLLEHDPAGTFWKLYKQERDARMARRYHAMALLCDLTPVDEVAELLHVHPDTVLNWIDRYNEGCLENLSPKKSSGRPPKLTRKEVARLKSDILTRPRKLGYKFSNWDGKAIRHHLKEKFGVEMTRNGIYALLHRMNLRLVMPRPRHAKADKKKDLCF